MAMVDDQTLEALSAFGINLDPDSLSCSPLSIAIMRA
jgi:hypothetical protein